MQGYTALRGSCSLHLLGHVAGQSDQGNRSYAKSALLDETATQRKIFGKSEGGQNWAEVGIHIEVNGHARARPHSDIKETLESMPMQVPGRGRFMNPVMSTSTAQYPKK